MPYLLDALDNFCGAAKPRERLLTEFFSNGNIFWQCHNE